MYKKFIRKDNKAKHDKINILINKMINKTYISLEEVITDSVKQGYKLGRELNR